jgi:hypothetical protein
LLEREHADQDVSDVVGGVGRLEAVAILALLLLRTYLPLLQLHEMVQQELG